MTLRNQWRKFRNDPPGSRFQQRYQRRNPNRQWWHSTLRVFGAVLAIVAGLIMLVLPGPGLLVMIAGAALLAEESLFTARLLDRFELWMRRRFARAK